MQQLRAQSISSRILGEICTVDSTAFPQWVFEAETPSSSRVTLLSAVGSAWCHPPRNPCRSLYTNSAPCLMATRFTNASLASGFASCRRSSTGTFGYECKHQSTRRVLCVRSEPGCSRDVVGFFHCCVGSARRHSCTCTHTCCPLRCGTNVSVGHLFLPQLWPLIGISSYPAVSLSFWGNLEQNCGISLLTDVHDKCYSESVGSTYLYT